MENDVIQEYKSSLTAPLTNNQARAFPEIFENGGVVVGKGKVYSLEDIKYQQVLKLQ